MPLVGTICCQDGSTQSFDHCINECRKGRCQHSVPLLVAMQGNSSSREGIGISASVLGGCPRQHILAERNDYYEDPEKYYPRWLGTIGHLAVENGGPYPGVITETRFYRDIETRAGGFTISGQPDWYDTEAHDLRDSKFVNFKPREVYPSHEAQVNVYAWILEGNGHPVESGHIDYYHGPNGPDRTRHSHYPVSMWTTEAVERYILRMLEPHIQYAVDHNLAKVTAPDDFAFGQNCPFLSPCNPGRCCRTRTE